MSHLIPLFRRLTETSIPVLPASSAASVEGEDLHGGNSGETAVQPLESVSTHGDQFNDYNDDDVYGDDVGGPKQGSGLVGLPLLVSCVNVCFSGPSCVCVSVVVSRQSMTFTNGKRRRCSVDTKSWKPFAPKSSLLSQSTSCSLPLLSHLVPVGDVLKRTSNPSSIEKPRLICSGSLKILKKKIDVSQGSQSAAVERLHTSRSNIHKVVADIEAKLKLDQTTDLPLFKPVRPLVILASLGWSSWLSDAVVWCGVVVYQSAAQVPRGQGTQAARTHRAGGVRDQTDRGTDQDEQVVGGVLAPWFDSRAVRYRPRNRVEIKREILPCPRFAEL
jgi:hypothetical protein